LPVIQNHFNIDGEWSKLPKPIMMELLNEVNNKSGGGGGGGLNSEPALLKTTTVSSVGPLWFLPDSVAYWRASVKPSSSEPTEEDSNKSSSNKKTPSSSSSSSSSRSHSQWPMCKSLKNYESFSVMPETHAVYAATWYHHYYNNTTPCIHTHTSWLNLSVSFYFQLPTPIHCLSWCG
jgi:hypothetical protein